MRIRITLVLSVVSTLVLCASAQGAVTVANTNDSGPGSLRQVVAEAPPGETVNLPAGTYSLTSGPLVVNQALTISGAGISATTIRAGGIFRVIDKNAVGGLALNDLTVRDGAVSDPGGVAFGGGIESDGPLSLQRVAVAANRVSTDGAAGSGGGIAFGAGIYAGQGLSLVDSSVTDNVVSTNGGAGKGGGIAQGGGIFVGNALTITNSTIAGNAALTRGGAGPSNPAQNGGIAQGGGIFAVQSEVAGSITGSTISGNTVDVSGGPGGGSGIGQGGGVFESVNKAQMSITNSTFVANTAIAASGGILQGGGLFASGSSPGVVISSSTLSGNRVESAGGGSGGNVYTSGEGSLANSIVANGVGSAGAENCTITGEKFVSLGFNLDSRDQCNFKAVGDKVNTDPLLGPLQGNGGLTQTMQPAANSPAVDQGRSFALTGDQRGLTRPVDLPTVPNSAAPGADGADIGAVELQAPPVPQQLLSNAFKLGKVTKNRKKGKASIQVILPQPSAGTLTLTGKALQKQTLTIKGEAQVSLPVVGNKKVRKALRKSGKRKVKLEVTYTPTGTPAATQSRTVKLVKKRAKKKKKAPTR